MRPKIVLIWWASKHAVASYSNTCSKQTIHRRWLNCNGMNCRCWCKQSANTTYEQSLGKADVASCRWIERYLKVRRGGTCTVSYATTCMSVVCVVSAVTAIPINAQEALNMQQESKG